MLNPWGRRKRRTRELTVSQGVKPGGEEVAEAAQKKKCRGKRKEREGFNPADVVYLVALEGFNGKETKPGVGKDRQDKGDEAKWGVYK